MNTSPRRLDVVALLSDLPEHGLVRGRVGTVVEILDGANEIEFSDDSGKTYAVLQPAIQACDTAAGLRSRGAGDV